VSNTLSAGFFGYTYEQWGYISAGAVIAIIALVAVVRIRRRRNAVYNVDEAGDDR
jgi:predicted MFS family arabinose efflux permease